MVKCTKNGIESWQKNGLNKEEQKIERQRKAKELMKEETKNEI
jgi:hypothetical protein